MQQETDKMQLFYEYYKQWIEVIQKRCNQGCHDGKVSDDAEMGRKTCSGVEGL